LTPTLTKRCYSRPQTGVKNSVGRLSSPKRGQPPPGLLHLGETAVCLFPDLEDFLVLLDGGPEFALLLVEPRQSQAAERMDQAKFCFFRVEKALVFGDGPVQVTSPLESSGGKIIAIWQTPLNEGDRG
jgi:hypothetical protein